MHKRMYVYVFVCVYIYILKEKLVFVCCFLCLSLICTCVTALFLLVCGCLFCSCEGPTRNPRDTTRLPHGPHTGPTRTPTRTPTRIPTRTKLRRASQASPASPGDNRNTTLDFTCKTHKNSVESLVKIRGRRNGRSPHE